MPNASRIAPMAAGEGPYGFSFALRRTSVGFIGGTAKRRGTGRAAAAAPAPRICAKARRERVMKSLLRGQGAGRRGQVVVVARTPSAPRALRPAPSHGKSGRVGD